MGICVFCARDEGIVPINYNINLEENLNNNEKKEEKIQNTTSDKIDDKKIFKFEPNISNETNIQKNLQYDGHKELINNFKNETLEMNKINKNNKKNKIKLNNI